MKNKLLCWERACWPQQPQRWPRVPAGGDPDHHKAAAFIAMGIASGLCGIGSGKGNRPGCGSDGP